MKVLFAVNNENISESIIKKYQQEYKEIISAKNVYYFNAIVKELQRDKTYDRIIISEDLQPFSDNNYDKIDKFIFETLDNISDEATNQSGNDIPIILICSDRREKAEPLLVKLFGIGVYNAMIGKDRSITQVCELLERPRTKKEAKVYYRIDSDDVDYKVENEGDVSEVEIQNILNHYKKIGGNEEKYVESFDHIASQYTDAQLRLIVKFLPLNVKAVLEAKSMKYQEIVSFSGATQKTESIKAPNIDRNKKFTKNKEKDDVQIDLVERNLAKNKLTEPVVIPSTINTANIKKMVDKQEHPEKSNVQKPEVSKVAPEQVQEIDDILDSLPTSEDETSEVENAQAVQPKRRGRPKKVTVEEKPEDIAVPKKGRGRPKKLQEEPILEQEDSTVQVEEPEIQDMPSEAPSAPLNLFELGDEDTQINQVKAPSQNDMILPGLDDTDLFENTKPVEQKNISNVTAEAPILPSIEDAQPQTQTENQFNQEVIQTTNNSENLNGLISKDRKIVAFVGTSKNGTTFLVNNIAELLSQKGINTAILDLTQNKNSYYIYTENEENLRKIAYSCINGLKNGEAKGIEVHKNLTVYTNLPGENAENTDILNILQTLQRNYSIVLLDCDFETDYNYFKEAQELYLVQSLDVLTIQPLTAFLRDLKAKNILYPEKIRIVLNKVLKLRSVSEKTIIGGMAFYNDPAMSFMTELFNKDTVQYCSIPFEEQSYSKYLEGLINCKITLNGYSKNFMASLDKLADMVYPLINNRKQVANKYGNYQSQNNFSNDMNSTLNKMKNNY